jgi:cytochrome c553
MQRSLSSLPLLLWLASAPFAGADAGTDFFEKKVRPVLVERCYECHSAEQKIKGGLRLDSRDGWLKGGDSGPAAQPGTPEKSLLVEAVHYTNRDMQMPPKQQLPKEEIAVLEEWVRMGAPDPRTEAPLAKKQTGMSLEAGRKFWSYAPVQKPAPPAVKDTAWPRSDLDRFTLAGMERAGVAPAADAPLPSLARRLYYNLVGLPPTPAQLETFLAEAAKDRETAVASLVDSLLASPHFGEAWGRHWLDITRFAESSGGGRTLLFKDAWRFREYVLESLNADVPLKQIIREHLAGDLLPSRTPAERRRQLAATAFLALGPTNYEEQDKQQLRFDVIDEQIESIGRAFLGQTLGCARCHDHKFDPVSQRDYYALAGILASTRTLLNYTDNVARWIVQPLPEEGEREEQIKQQESRLAKLRVDVDAAKSALSEMAKSSSVETTSPGTPLDLSRLEGILLDDSEAKVVGFWKPSVFVRKFIGKGYVSDNNEGKGEKTLTFTPSLPESGRYEVRLAYSHLSNRAKNVRVNILHADGEDSVFVDQTEPPPIDGHFVSLGKFRFEKDGAGYVLISNEGTKGFVVVDALQFLPEKSSNTSNTPPSTPTASSKPTPEARAAKPGPSPKPDNSAQAAKRKELAALEAELKKASAEGPFRSQTMAVYDDETVEDAQIRIRGVERQKGEKVPRGFLQVALAGAQPALPQHQSGRLELADWIASDRNPLTARVLVNRVWTWLFGNGLVRTVDNFGTTGEAPTHPELLDYLATRFVEEGWSLKKLVRSIVLTRTWQQAVEAPGTQDPDNRLLTHANRRRLNAEQIRDSLLMGAGKLDLQVGGQNMEGAGDIDANNASAQNIEYNYVYKDLRRSFYTPAFRNKRLELFEAFDFGDINQPIGQRNTSTVATQALFFLNNPFVSEQAQAASALTLSEGTDDPSRLRAASMRILGRPPSPRETAIFEHFLRTGLSSEQAWTQIHQVLFASLDFRYLH